jgi:hypothetical protein
MNVLAKLRTALKVCSFCVRSAQFLADLLLLPLQSFLILLLLRLLVLLLLHALIANYRVL